MAGTALCSGEEFENKWSGSTFLYYSVSKYLQVDIPLGAVFASIGWGRIASMTEMFHAVSGWSSGEKVVQICLEIYILFYIW